MAKAADDVIVDHADRLHEGIADRGTDELKAASLELLAHRVRLRRLGRHLLGRLPGMMLHTASDELPDVTVEASEFLQHAQECLGVLDGCLDLEPVADDSWIGQQCLHFPRTEPGDHFRVKALESLSVVFALLENGLPTKSCLRTLENKKLKQPVVGMHRNAPFRV